MKHSEKLPGEGVSGACGKWQEAACRLMMTQALLQRHGRLKTILRGDIAVRRRAPRLCGVAAQARISVLSCW